ncbi:uncharacterized protein LOC130408220 isoform X2 [Triplophysa dalaica]|uniref:uncharacterized protein LOC130408220 isoform X2 n=1 Tax=Triplophysa dalaica TaxID=1582913 RepID=UPI0024DF6CE7|nr:uncharacterized protein LOC130408220 isoform X2 [Triplophysa dalaica]XP_056587681.1 uncharacterized protein LOC130408220 isoform X2 [Triplophysa dalaica]
MIVKKSSRGKGRNVTPMRAASSINVRTCVPILSGCARRGRQRSKLNSFGCNKDRLVRTGGKYLNGRPLISGSRRGHCKVMMTASASKDSSQDTTSMIMPSGVSSFLLDCLDDDDDSPTLNMDSSLSSIEEFRRADHFDEGITVVDGNGMMNSVKNSTLLDLSHAQDLALHQPPNLSSILELSLDTAEDKQKNSFSLSPISLFPLCVPSETLASDIASGCVLKLDEKRAPANERAVGPVLKKQHFSEKETSKPIKCRKVMFSDIVSIRNISNHRCNKIENHHCGHQQDELVKQKEDITREESQDIFSGPAKFFHFADECEREAFFRRLKRTCSFQFPAKMRISILSPPSQEIKTRGTSRPPCSSQIPLRLMT